MITTPGARTLVRLLKNPEITDDLKEADWAQVCLLAERCQVSPYIFGLLKDNASLLPQQWHDELKTHYLFSLGNNLKLWQEFLTVHRAFKEASIPLVPLKGVDILARFYPCFDTRIMADIDVLVKEDDYAQAALTLEKLGYQKNLEGLKEEYWRRRHCHVGFLKGLTSVEIHWALDLKRKTALLPFLWQRIREHRVQDRSVALLSAEDAVFCFALHLRRFGNTLALKQVLDAARLINDSQDFSWEYLLKEARCGHMQATLFFLLTQISLFTGTQVPSEVFEKLHISRQHKKKILDFILSGTFDRRASLKLSYLKAHFLLYDTFFEPFWYIIAIPYEQFCKFYDLRPYTKKADISYFLRLLYIPFRLCAGPVARKRTNNHEI